jgi:hypothetical protein
MKKFTFLLGLGIGFVLGARAGREKYDRLVERTQEFASRPDVQDAARTAGDQVRKGAEYVKEHAPAAASAAASAAGDAVRNVTGSEDAETTGRTSTFQAVDDPAAAPADEDDYQYPEGTADNPAR